MNKTMFPAWERAFSWKSAHWGLGTPDCRNVGPGHSIPMLSHPLWPLFQHITLMLPRFLF